MPESRLRKENDRLTADVRRAAIQAAQIAADVRHVAENPVWTGKRGGITSLATAVEVLAQAVQDMAACEGAKLDDAYKAGYEAGLDDERL